jgi:hypothetical protein
MGESSPGVGAGDRPRSAGLARFAIQPYSDAMRIVAGKRIVEADVG